MLTPQHKAAMMNFASSHNGQKLDTKSLLKANPMVQKVLMAEYQVAFGTEFDRRAI